MSTANVTDADLEKQAEWDDYMPVLLADIEAGHLDTHLRALVRACYSRRDVLKGTRTVVPEDGTIVDVPPPAPHQVELTKTLRYPASYTKNTFRFMTYRYDKDDFKGNHFKVRDQSGFTPVWTGCVFQVLDVKTTKVLVKFKTWPTQGSITPKTLKDLENGLPMLVDIAILRPYMYDKEGKPL